jgi:hypothetical protein
MRLQSTAIRRPGLSLLELPVTLAVLAEALALTVILLGGALKLERGSAKNLQRLETERELAAQFRADVQRADNAPQRWQEHTAGPACVILHSPSNQHIVYCWEGEHLIRSEFVGEQVQRREIGLGDTPAQVEFDGSQDHRLLTLRLFSIGKDGVQQTPITISAALGGDLQ